MINEEDFLRYSRQMIIPNFEEEGQEIILNTKILIIGAGGLGCSTALYCAAAGFGEIGIIDYDKIIEYATLDPRLGDSHWGVPGPDGDFGFGGHCFPKDLSALIEITKQLNTVNNVLRAVQTTNNTVRSNRDWEKMKGRAIV